MCWKCLIFILGFDWEWVIEEKFVKVNNGVVRYFLGEEIGGKFCIEGVFLGNEGIFMIIFFLGFFEVGC